MVKLKKAFKRSFALVAAVVVSVVAFCFPAAAASSTLPVQTVSFDGISVSAINVSGTIQSKVVETNYRSCMLRFWPGSSAKVAFVISNSSFFRVRSGFKYHLKLRASLSGLAFKKIGVAFGIDGGNLMNLPAEIFITILPILLIMHMRISSRHPVFFKGIIPFRLLLLFLNLLLLSRLLIFGWQISLSRKSTQIRRLWTE